MEAVYPLPRLWTKDMITPSLVTPSLAKRYADACKRAANDIEATAGYARGLATDDAVFLRALGRALWEGQIVNDRIWIELPS